MSHIPTVPNPEEEPGPLHRLAEGHRRRQQQAGQRLLHGSARVVRQIRNRRGRRPKQQPGAETQKTETSEQAGNEGKYMFRYRPPSHSEITYFE